jgi:hypothetical protein
MDYEDYKKAKAFNDSIRRADSLEYLLESYSIQKEDSFYKKLFDTSFSAIHIKIHQSGDILKLFFNHYPDTLDKDTNTVKYYELTVDLLKDKKILKRQYTYMLGYYGYRSRDYNFEEDKTIHFVRAVNKVEPPADIEIPIWHIQYDTLPELEVTCLFKLSYNERKITNTKTKGLTKNIATFKKSVYLKNYKYSVKEFTLDSVHFPYSGDFDAGLFNKPDLFYNLYTPFNSLSSPTDEQFKGGIPDIRKMYLFLRQTEGDIILHFKDEDVIYHDFLGALRFSYSSNDSSYHFKFDTSFYKTKLSEVHFSLKKLPKN